MGEMWSYRDETIGDIDLSGYSVEAVDGGIGKIDEATYDVGSSYIVVDTGPWIFGRKVLLPAGVIQEIDLDNERIVVSRTRDEIKDGPEYDPDRGFDATRRSEYDAYYRDRSDLTPEAIKRPSLLRPPMD
jgi:hypothetical protein